MRPISNNIVERVIEDFEDEIEDAQKKALANLNKIKGSFTAQEDSFLQDVKKLFADKSILTDNPERLDNHIARIKKVPIPVRPKKKGRKPKSLKDHILDALNYKGLRSSFYPAYFQKIGIRACVYCNAQLTVSVDHFDYLKTKTNRKVKAKFQVDHFHAKSDYPYLSISLYNLYPACASCNIAKSNNPVKFKLYSADEELSSKYRFELEPGCVAKFLKNRDTSQISIKFIDPEKPNVHTVVKGSFQDTFDIQGVYEIQVDIVEELILKAEVYKESYKDKLISSFPQLFTNASITNRFIIGNYSEPSEIHKRPMAKFTMDISRQLKLIK